MHRVDFWYCFYDFENKCIKAFAAQSTFRACCKQNPSFKEKVAASFLHELVINQTFNSENFFFIFDLIFRSSFQSSIKFGSFSWHSEDILQMLTALTKDIMEPMRTVKRLTKKKRTTRMARTLKITNSINENVMWSVKFRLWKNTISLSNYFYLMVICERSWRISTMHISVLRLRLWRLSFLIILKSVGRNVHRCSWLTKVSELDEMNSQPLVGVRLVIV